MYHNGNVNAHKYLTDEFSDYFVDKISQILAEVQVNEEVYNDHEKLNVGEKHFMMKICF
jgi:hypothetical protein